jgi:DNA-binding NarL/FixJ family response regulator
MPAAIAIPSSTEPRMDESAPTSPISVLVYAKDPISRAGVASQLLNAPNIEVVAPTSGQTALVAIVVAEAIDEEVVRVVRTIRRANRTQVVVVAGSIDTGSMLAAVDAGAAGFLLRPMASRERLVEVVLAACHGGPVPLLPAAIGGPHPAPSFGPDVQPDLPAVAQLTARELEVLRLLAEGSDTAEIAARLAYSEPTIKNVIQRLFERLQVRNRPHAVAVALRAGII